MQNVSCNVVLKTIFLIIISVTIFFSVLGAIAIGFTNDAEFETVVDKKDVATKDTPAVTSSVSIEPPSGLSQEDRNQLQIKNVLDHCNTVGERTDILLRFKNETHAIDNISCNWEELSNKETSQLTSYNEERALDKINDLCKNGDGRGSFVHFNNNTHYIDSVLCEWEQLENDESVSYILKRCADGNAGPWHPNYREWSNHTDFINTKTCDWNNRGFMTKAQWEEHTAHMEGKMTVGHKVSQWVVKDMIAAYVGHDEDLTKATGTLVFKTSYKDRFFVIDEDSEEILIHPDPDRVGKNAVFLDVGTLVNYTEGHIAYQDINTRDGDLDDAIAWLQYHDGLYFGSFFFETDCYEPENSRGCDG